MVSSLSTLWCPRPSELRQTTLHQNACHARIPAFVFPNFLKRMTCCQALQPNSVRFLVSAYLACFSTEFPYGIHEVRAIHRSAQDTERFIAMAMAKSPLLIFDSSTPPRCHDHLRVTLECSSHSRRMLSENCDIKRQRLSIIHRLNQDFTQLSRYKRRRMNTI